MSIINTRPAPLRLLSAAPEQRRGGMFYRWHVRREQIRQLTRLLDIDDARLDDLGLSRARLQAEIAALRRKPV